MGDNKMLCPACDAYTSSVFRAFRDGEPCPSCGLSASAAAEVVATQESRASDDLKEKLEAAIVERDRAQAEARKARSHLERIKRAVADDPDDDGGPW